MTAAPDVVPCPVFEGSEKRIAVTFTAGPSTPAGGLRSLRRDQLDEMLDLAACQIVSSRSNDFFDAYVLSESSLFVYPGAAAAGAVWRCVLWPGGAVPRCGHARPGCLGAVAPEPQSLTGSRSPHPPSTRRPHGPEDLRHHQAAVLCAPHVRAGGGRRHVACPGQVHPRLLPVPRAAARAPHQL